MAILEWKLASLRQQVALLEDAKAIERLQQTYGYYISEGMGGEAAALFSDDPGNFHRAGPARRVCRQEAHPRVLTHGGEGLKDGELQEGAIWQGVVNVSPDGKNARGRWRTLIMGGTYGQDGTWTGRAVRKRVREGKRGLEAAQGALVHDRERLVRPGLAQEAHYARRWGRWRTCRLIDRPRTKYESWPAFYLPPYHYEHPVTGKPLAWD